MGNQQKVTFKICYMYPGTDAKSIEVKTTDKNGSVIWVDNEGSANYRAMMPGEVAKNYVLMSIEPFVFQGEVKKRVYTRVSYLPASEEGTLEGSERSENISNRMAHDILKQHQHVVVRDKSNSNVNPNQMGLPLFELIEDSVQILADVNKNSRISEAMAIATDMFKNTPQVFVDFCYSYNIKPIDGVPVAILYNEVVAKLMLNPEDFFSVINHKDAITLVLLKKAEQKTGDDNLGLINQRDGFYYMDGEIIGASEDTAIHFLNTNPSKKDFLLRKLGITPAPAVEVVPLPPVSVDGKLTAPQKLYKEKTDAARIQTMKMEVGRTIKKMRAEMAADKSMAGQIEKNCYDNLTNTIREKYVDVVEAFDTYVATQKARKE